MAIRPKLRDNVVMRDKFTLEDSIRVSDALFEADNAVDSETWMSIQEVRAEQYAESAYERHLDSIASQEQYLEDRALMFGF